MESKKGTVKLSASGMKLAEYIRCVYAVTVDFGVTIEDVLRPEFWANVSTSLKVNDRIEVLAEDGTFYAELIVLDCSPTHAKVAILTHRNFSSVETEKVESTPDYKVTWGGNTAKFRIIRVADNAVVHSGEATKQAADLWLSDYIAALSR